MSTHTKEPWSVHRDEYIISKGRADIAMVQWDESCEEQYMVSEAESEANADRIVACVNALAGLNAEAVKGLEDACTHVVRSDSAPEYLVSIARAALAAVKQEPTK